MIFSRLIPTLRAFRRKEDGNATVEFVIIIPLMLMILFSSVELGVITVRQTMLDRAVDLTVRDLRLGTGSGWQHDDIRDTICDRSGFIESCSISLKLEMVQVDPFNWVAIDEEPDCITSVEEVNPVTTFINGDSNDLMFLRACMKFNPIFPYWGLGDALQKDEDGRVNLYAASAFVQEPK